MKGAPALTVVLVGATGVIGRRATAEIARAAEVKRIVAVGRDAGALRELGELFEKTGKLETTIVPSERAALAELFRRGDVVVSCAGPADETEAGLVEAALTANVPYVSLCDDVGSTRAALEIRGGGDRAATVVLGCGLRPGLTNLLFNLAVDELDEVESASIAVAGSVASEDGPATELHVLQSIAQGATVISEGQIELKPSGSSPQLVYFPEPVGWVETFPCAHPEVFTLHRSHPELRDLEWSFGLAERSAMDALRASAALGFARSRARRRQWLRLSRPLRPLIERFSVSTGGWNAARVDVWGTKGGRPREIALGVVDHLPNLATGLLAWAAVGLGSGAIHKPGIWPPEDVLDARVALRHMSKRGVRVARLEPSTI